ncbi:MAG: hypothetical protein ACOC56_00925 [Atribacterota bacterium]
MITERIENYLDNTLNKEECEDYITFLEDIIDAADDFISTLNFDSLTELQQYLLDQLIDLVYDEEDEEYDDEYEELGEEELNEKLKQKISRRAHRKAHFAYLKAKRKKGSKMRRSQRKWRMSAAGRRAAYKAKRRKKMGRVRKKVYV